MSALDAAYLAIVLVVGIRELYRSGRSPVRAPRIRYRG